MPTNNPSSRERIRLDLRGQVQGVGFRPFVYRIATEQGLAGLVANNSTGAVIEVEGSAAAIAQFQRDLTERLPPLAKISQLEQTELPPAGETEFRIETSQRDAQARAEVTPDAATCADCLHELFDATDRRCGYPFINCTNCGPRYSIIQSVPYDRPATTMARFTMCPACQAEYDNPADRRFHAQPNACPECGPHLRLHPEQDTQSDAECVQRVADLLRNGGIVAIKGIGGYHLACRADDEEVVARLRERKLRDGKPLAIMVANIDAAERLCHISTAAREALLSPAAPIVLMPQRAEHSLAPSVAPGCGDFGVMLPYAPLHHLLFAAGLGPLVMTSANLAGQPLTYRDADAVEKLGDVADAFLMHDRPIHRPIDDSVVIAGDTHATPIRRARGYAPQPIRVDCLPRDERISILAVGAELKSTIALCCNGEVILSEHLGDLGNADAYRHFIEAIDRLRQLYEFTPTVVAHDLHPQILSTQHAQRLGLPTIAVQHHHAHVAALMAEHNEPGPVIGLSCDGVGYGADGAVWGCEILRCERGDYRRLGHLDYFPLVGGDAAAVETWRPLAAMLHQAFGNDWQRFMPERTGVSRETLLRFEQQLAAGLNAPPTSSLGRVFDGISCLLGLCVQNRHEAEGAMALEAAAGAREAAGLPHSVEVEKTDIRLSLTPAIRELAARRAGGADVGDLAATFHETLAQMLAMGAQIACLNNKIKTVALSGGCFANKRLLTRIRNLLQQCGISTLYHERVPCGDGGVALGQAFVAAWRAAERPDLLRGE